MASEVHSGTSAVHGSELSVSIAWICATSHRNLKGQWKASSVGKKSVSRGQVAFKVPPPRPHLSLSRRGHFPRPLMVCQVDRPKWTTLTPHPPGRKQQS